MLNLINGNKQAYQIGLPNIVIVAKEINEVALEWLKSRTGLVFEKCWNTYEAQPTEPDQIVRFLMTCNVKTRYYNNSDFKNELRVKFDHHIGFDVDSICFECVKQNHIHIGTLKEGDRLAC